MHPLKVWLFNLVEQKETPETGCDRGLRFIDLWMETEGGHTRESKTEKHKSVLLSLG